MSDTVVRMRLMSLLVLACVTASIWLLPYAQTTSAVTSPYLQVHFLDVGQGDAIFIQTPSGAQALIDGGRDASVLRELSTVMGFFDKDIDVVVGTHPDSDHIGGLIDVLKRYKVGTILKTENKGDTSTAELYAKLSAQEGAEVFNVRRGQTFRLDASTTLSILFPDSDPTEMESNTSSIVLQLKYGSSTFLFTGDSPKNIEEYLVLVEGEYLQSDVLKVGHHGSRTSTSELFLDEVQPQFAIISAGKDNSYGHPHVEVTDLLFNKRVQTFSTAEEGTITFVSDGAEVWKK
jgi:competence protein ComEC